MATTSLGIISSGAVQGSASSARASSSFRNRGTAQRRFLLAPGRSFRAFRTIKKASPRLSAKSPRLNRSSSRRFVRVSTSAMADPRIGSFFAAKEQEDDVMKSLASGSDGGSVDDAVVEDSNRVVDTVNAVLADVVDGQKFIKETGRTKPRPMKRRALVVCLALGAFRGPLNDVEGRVLGGSNLGRSASTSRLARVPSSGFARTAHLISQLSFGAPKSPAGSQVADINKSVEN